MNTYSTTPKVLKICYYFFILFIFACGRKVNNVQLNEEFKKISSDTSDIIATQFKDENIDTRDVIVWNDSKYKNAFMLKDSIYFDFEHVQYVLNSSKIKSRSEYSYSISLDTNYIKQIFESHKTDYSGQNRLVTWK